MSDDTKAALAAMGAAQAAADRVHEKLVASGTRLVTKVAPSLVEDRILDDPDATLRAGRDALGAIKAELASFADAAPALVAAQVATCGTWLDRSPSEARERTMAQLGRKGRWSGDDGMPGDWMPALVACFDGPQDLLAAHGFCPPTDGCPPEDRLASDLAPSQDIEHLAQRAHRACRDWQKAQERLGAAIADENRAKARALWESA